MKKIIPIIFALTFVFASCEKDPKPGDLEHIPYAPQEKVLKRLTEFPEMVIPVDNPLTAEGIELGRRLFYDPILSIDSTKSCFSCHLPAGAFTDNLAFSEGVNGATTKRSSITLMNVGYNERGLFWDGRAATMEELNLLPIEDPHELHDTWENVENKLRQHTSYPELFRKAFGVKDRKEIDRFQVAKAIAQFNRTMIVGEGSRFYKVFILQEDFPTDEELNGYLMYFDASGGSLPDAQCFHCHNRPLFTNNDYMNNGIQPTSSLNDFKDKGRGAITGNLFDNGKFKTPTLWNIELTAPYMHDGRFKTLKEVLDHYASGGHYADNLDPLISDIKINDRHKKDLLAFLKTLTDTTFVRNPEFQNPFK
jgi:cytochrome c peroxidase